MASVQRKRGGPTNPVKSKIQAGVQVEIGDLCALVAGYVVNAATFAAVGAAGTDVAGELFHDSFLGVLAQGATTGDETEDTECLVETVGDYEYPIAALGQEYAVGQLIGPYDPDSGNGMGDTLASQQVGIADATDEAIGRLAATGASGATTVLVRIKSVIMDGGEQSAE